jgi:putative ABC transport system permease protein
MTDIWLPLTMSPADRRDYLTLARLAPGASLERAQGQLNLLTRRLESSDSRSRNHSFDAMWLKTDLLRDQERVPLALLAAVGFLLALSCANLSALLLAKSVARRREMAIRAALGASGGRQMRQLLTESLLLAIPAGAVGLAIAIAAQRPLFALVPQVLGEELQYRATEIKPSLVVFTLVLSGIVALLFGLAPALRASRGNPVTALGAGERSATAAREGRRMLSAFVIGEIALSTTLLAGATLMIGDLAQLQTQPLGISPRGLLSMEVPFSAVPDTSGEGRDRKIRALVDAVRTVPGVRSAAATTVNPFWGGTWGIGVGPAGRIDPGAPLPTVNFRMTTPGLLRTSGTALIAGRDFTEDDRDGSAAVAIVSRRLASRLWPGTPAVGQDLVRRASDGSTLPMRVVGVAEDVRDAGDLEGAVYLPCAQLARQVELERIYIMARGPGPSGPWIREAARAVGRVDPRLAVAEAETMDVLYDRTIAQNRLGTKLLAAVAAFGLLLATMGIYTVVAFTAGERRLEFAIRTALGAAPAEIRRLILRQGLVLGIAGCGAGLALALALNRLLARALHGFPSSLWLPMSVALLLFAATLAASSVPALRAAHIDPSDTLRSV